MKFNHSILPIVIILTLTWSNSRGQEDISMFFNQPVPGDIPEIFAKDIVSYPFMNHSSVAISSNMDEIYWSKWYDSETRQEIVYTKRVKGEWTTPAVAPFSGQYSDDVPFFAPDNKTLYFLSRRPLNEFDNSNAEHIWYVERITGGEWSEPRPVPTGLASLNIHWQFSVSADHTIFFNSAEGMKFSEFTNGKYLDPVLITEAWNKNYIGGNPYVSPDKSYIIFSSKVLPGSFGKNDLYIGFSSPDGTWTDPINLGSLINGAKNDLCAIISPDGRYMFYIRQDDVYNIYWVDAGFIDKLRKEAR